ncbi:glutathione S-transferase family protein [Pseudoxanthobacter sp. M-2]|uniref:glutathione S-transferase family protein n=1 Tax=Pseudoxanthobacter sp. M-2 TaxID=3078754 RepID=UPI0038FC5EFA
MKLYWSPNTRSTRALWLMEEAGLPYERVKLDLAAGEHKRPAFLAVNPMGKVPALENGAAKVAESAALCAYVADLAPASGLAPPIGDPDRGRFLHWLFFSAGCIEPAYMQKAMGWTIDRPSLAGWGGYEAVMDVLDAAVAPGPWLLGDRFTAADVMVGTDLHFGVRLFKFVESRPNFEAYIDRCEARPAFQRAAAINAAGV